METRTGMSQRYPIHVLLVTHTTRHLRRTLVGVASQTRPADSVTLSCDVEDDDIRRLASAAARELGLSITLARRPHQGQSRSAQVRNNAVRALLERGAAEGLLVFLDGDCCPAPDVLETYDRLRANRDLIVGYRIDLTPEQTEAFDEQALREGRRPVEPTAGQLRALRHGHWRYLRAAALRRLGLRRDHKPKVLSANFGVTLDIYRRINGFDEEYLGWGGEDDDLGRRVYLAGGRPIVGVRDLTVYHLYHEARATGRWRDAPGVKRFLAGGPTRCVHGLDNPYEQPPVEVLVLEPSPRASLV